MTRSKPNTLRCASLALYLLSVASLNCLLAIEWLTDWKVVNALALAFLTNLAFFAVFFFILVELPKVLTLKIDDNKIVMRNFLTRRTKEFWLEDIHSFKVSVEIGIFNELEINLILLHQGKAFDSVSLQYMVNVDQIINQLEKHLSNETDDEYGFLRLVRGQRNN
ncbi:MAG TPA: hypothetical protein VL728_05265 [Cyclobacteriaceae bacterium]|jgi:hypothetical protein|nr:hypothetical protein [Cyclobacteriaceae bacterium]